MMKEYKHIIKCENICKSYGDGDTKLRVLKSVSLEINDGEFLMLVGPSGSGKTTLISIIAGTLSLDNGKCMVMGHDYSKFSQDQMLNFRAANIGFVFQSYNLIPALTIAENVAIPLMIQDYDKEDAIKQAKEQLEIVGLGSHYDQHPNTLSGGQQQRVAIARALIHKPKIVICDEPTSALDFTTGTKIISLMRDINKNLSTTFVVITHDNRILQYADRQIYLNDGQIEGIK